MEKRKFTIVTQLHEKNNKDVIAYVDCSLANYNKAKRETFRAFMCTSNFNKSQYNTYLQKKYGIMKRTAGSIISDAIGTYNALRELKEYELQQVELKIKHLEENVIPKLINKRNKNSCLLKENPNDRELVHKQQNLRRKIVAKKNKLNKLKQRRNNLLYQIETKRFKICFGTKRLLQKDHDAFVKQRDSQMSFVGSLDESCGNQLLQLTYNKKNNQFAIQLRKDFGGFKDANKQDKYVYGKCYFNHHKKKLIDVLKNGSGPLSYKIIKKDGKFYLYCTFEYVYDEKESKVFTSERIGAIGLDFNKGFIATAETNHYGDMVNTKKHSYRFKSGNKTETDLYEIANKVVKQAIKTQKCIVIEDLNFQTTKAKTESANSKKGKKYNEMLHSLAYKKFVHIIESVCYKNNVKLIKVNPAWTSYIAKHKFCETMKLNVHTGASFVIARRGQGYKDKVTTKNQNQSKNKNKNKENTKNKTKEQENNQKAKISSNEKVS